LGYGHYARYSQHGSDAADPNNGDYMFHGGINIPAPHGTLVYAVADGIVNRAIKFHYSLGNFFS